MGYVRHFLQPRVFDICWDGKPRGQVSMNQGIPQGIPVSPILWCAFFSRTLKRIDSDVAALAAKETHPGQRRSSRTSSARPNLGLQVLTFSYVDDVNLLVITRDLSSKEHNKVVDQVTKLMEEAAEEEHLT